MKFYYLTIARALTRALGDNWGLGVQGKNDKQKVLKTEDPTLALKRKRDPVHSLLNVLSEP